MIELEDQYELVETKNFPSYANFNFEKFNPVQSRIFEIYNKDCNVIVAAQTSAGKTICSEMMMSESIREKGGKAMYLAPLKALAKEKVDDWTDEKHHFSDLNLAICTGDYKLDEKRKSELENSNIILMTSEMLNSRCRNYKSENNNWLKELKILVIDESHLLTVSGRGDHLESGLMKFTKIAPHCKIVALSATMPNVSEISRWIESLNGKETYLINSKYRPCPLSIHYETYEDVGTYEMKEESKIDKVIDTLRKYKEDKFIVFVHSKNTGYRIKKYLDQQNIESEIHNADLDKEKRDKVEKRFKYGDLRVIVATSTLAWGCYEKGTIVLTEDGLEKIENISVGQKVMSMTSKGFSPCKVLKTGKKKVNKTIEITLNSGESAKVSEDHKFYGDIDRESPGYYKANKFSIDDYIAIPADVKDLLNSKIKFSKIKNIIIREEDEEMYDIEVEDSHNYVGGGLISHNCNFPARRVIITGVHRGMSEVPTYDITQMAGRAGRVGFDPKGDVHILLPKRTANIQKNRLLTPQNINSQLLNYIGNEDNPHYKTLAFHLVSEIHHGEIKTIDDIHAWYDRSLAKFQSFDLDDSIVDKTVELLSLVSAIKEKDGKYEATSIGKVSSLLYYSPFDTADLRRNFKFLFTRKLQNSDLAISMALGNVDSIRMGYVTKSEKEEMETYHNYVKNNIGDVYSESSIKGGYIYYCLLNGHNLGSLNSLGRALQQDFERTISVLNLLDTMAAKWNKKDYFNVIKLRVAYGVKPELISLCSIPNIGKVRAEKLYAAGLKKPSDLIGNFDKVKKVLNMKDEKIKEIIKNAK